MTKLGETLKKLRFKKGMTQGELADAININKASVSNYERGHRNPPYAVLCAMAEVLEVQADELLACVIPEESYTADDAKENQVDSIRQRRVRRLLAAFDKLSDEAQLKAIERVEELGMIPAYQRKLADTLQQYIYNRCRIKMQVVEEPLEEGSCEAEADVPAFENRELRWKVKHITLQHSVEKNYTLSWNFHYLSFGNSESEMISSTGIVKKIIDRSCNCEENPGRTAFVFDDEAIFNNFYYYYAERYAEPAFEQCPIPDSAWALFLLVDKETWAVMEEKEFNQCDYE